MKRLPSASGTISTTHISHSSKDMKRSAPAQGADEASAAFLFLADDPLHVRFRTVLTAHNLAGFLTLQPYRAVLFRVLQPATRRGCTPNDGLQQSLQTIRPLRSTVGLSPTLPHRERMSESV